MQPTIQLDVAACLVEDGFSLDELVIKTRELFEAEGGRAGQRRGTRNGRGIVGVHQRPTAVPLACDA
jgi:hypothetical protein